MKYALIVIVAALSLIIFSVGVVALLFINRPQPEQRELSTPVMVVDTFTAQYSPDIFRVTAQGSVRPTTETMLASEVSGRIVRLSEQFVAGGFFRAGDVLIEIDPSDYEAALLQAQADLAAARATLADESARSAQARQDWQRLHGQTREAGDLVLRLPQVARAEASVQAAEAAVMRAERNLERTRIRLPYDGLVRTRQADLGQFVSTGTVLGTVFAVETAEVRLPLSDSDLAFLDLPAPGQPASLRPSVRLTGSVAGQRGEWHGEIVRTEGVIDENTRLSFAVVRIRDPYGLLERERQLPLPMGTFVSAEIDGRSARGLIELPRTALRSGDTVLVASEDGRLDIRQVDVVRATTHSAYVHGGIEAGDHIITTAIQAPIPGMPIRRRETPPQAEPSLRLLAPEEAELLESES